jgi:hypothetical protein
MICNLALKKQISCNDAIATAKTPIKHFTDRGNTVTASVLDLSKAFDKVNFYGLFIKLIDKSAPISLIRILVSWYTRSEVVVRWVSVVSEAVKLLAGVR